MSFVWILGVIAVVVVVLIATQKKSKYSNLVPLIPNNSWIPQFRITPPTTEGTLKFFRENTQSYGSLFRKSVVWGDIVYVTDPESINDIFSKMRDEFPNRPIFGAKPNRELFIKRGLLRLKDEEWAHTRRIINPLFGWGVMADAFPDFLERTNTLFSRFDKQISESKLEKLEIDARHEMAKITIDVIGKVGFGYDLNAVQNNDNEVTKALGILFTPNPMMAVIPYWFKVPTQNNKDRIASIKLLHQVVDKMIKEQRNNKAEPKQGQRKNFLQIMMEQEGSDQMSDQDFFDECMTMFVAGHETTSTLLAWLYYEVARNPPIQDKIHEELDQVLQGKPITPESSKDLKYLSAAIDEALRLHPPGVFILREAAKDVEYKGYMIEKGTIMFAHLWYLGRDSRYFSPFANQFDPSKFLGDKPLGPEYIPFGTGPHICVGKKMALTEAKVIAATFFQKYKIELKPNQNIEEMVAFITTPKDDVKLLLTPRK